MSARVVALTSLRCLGLMKLWRYASRGKIPILMLHGVAAPNNDGCCTPLRPRLSLEDFDRHMRVLSRSFRFVSLQDAVEMLSGSKPLQPYSLVLTFDDAYLNNVTAAWAVLKEYRAPATFFVPTGYVGTRRAFWADRLDYTLQHLPQERPLALGSTPDSLTDNGRGAMVSLFWQLKDACMALGWRRAEEIVNAIEGLSTSKLTDSSRNEGWAGFMTWEHIQSMQREGATFGSHTVEHSLLDELSPNEIMRELKDSKEELERRTGVPCTSIAYPRGRYSEPVVAMAQEAGYRSAVTTVDGLAGLSDSVMTLPRIGLPLRSAGSSDLLARVTGLSQALARVRAFLTPAKNGQAPLNKANSDI